MGYYIFRKKELMKQLEQIDDNDFIMIQMGGHIAPSHPITCVEDSTSIGFWEIRCDAKADFWEEIEKAKLKMNYERIINRRKSKSL